MKVHIRHTRLYNNAGMIFPTCKAGERLLDLDAARWPIASMDDYLKAKDKSVFCKKCVAKLKK